MEEEKETPASEETQEEELELNLTEETEESKEGEKEETLEEIKARLAKAEELAENQKKRAEKAEKALPKKKEEVKQKDLSTSDLYALMNSKVPEEDVEDVREYATLKGISVAEALKSNVVKTILADKAEQRTTAEATHTGAARRTTTRPTGEALLEKAKKGEMPESEADIAEIFKARKGIK